MMKTLYTKYSLWIMSGVFLLISFSCEKSFDKYRNAQPIEKSTSLNDYEFLAQQNQVYDSLLYLLDKTGLDSILKNEAVTFFAPQDISIMTVLKNVNVTRREFGYTTTWTLDSIPTPVWDTLLRRYMEKGIVTSDSLNYADGVDLTTLSYGYQVNGKRVEANASGEVKGGPFQIEYSAMNNSRMIKDWTRSKTQTIDIRTKNGLIHVLENIHVFGFESFVGMAFPESTIPRLEPYFGVPAPVPGTIQAVDFDFGGEGLAYHDNDPENQGGQYRNTGVDIARHNEGGYEIGWTNDGEWTKYTIDVEEEGWYKFEIYVGTIFDNGWCRHDIYFDDEYTGTVGSIPLALDYQAMNWCPTTFYLKEGVQVMKVVRRDWANDLKAFRFTKIDPPISTPYGGTPAAIPGYIVASYYDKGGQGVGYNDTNPANNMGDWHNRGEGVDEECCYTGVPDEPDIGWVFKGEWCNYTVNVDESGEYKVKVKVSSDNSTGRFHIEFDGEDKTGEVAVPNTGDFKNFQIVETTVDLEAGEQVMKFFVDAMSFNYASFEFIKQ